MVLIEVISAREDNKLLGTIMDINIADTAKMLQRFVKCCWLSPININAYQLAASTHILLCRHAQERSKVHGCTLDAHVLSEKCNKIM